MARKKERGLVHIEGADVTVKGDMTVKSTGPAPRPLVEIVGARVEIQGDFLAENTPTSIPKDKVECIDAKMDDLLDLLRSLGHGDVADKALEEARSAPPSDKFARGHLFLNTVITALHAISANEDIQAFISLVMASAPLQA